MLVGHLEHEESHRLWQKQVEVFRLVGLAKRDTATRVVGVIDSFYLEVIM